MATLPRSYQLVKQADFLTRMQEEIDDSGMTEKEYHEYVKDLKTKHNGKLDHVDYLYAEKPTDIGGSYYVHGKDIHDKPFVKGILGLDDHETDPDRAVIMSVPVKHIILHESGHAADEDLEETQRKINFYNKMGLISLPTAFLAGMVNNKYVKGVGIGASAVGGGIADYMAATETLQGEERANDFVRRHLQEHEHGGDADAAQESYEGSLLPEALNTYKTGRIVQTVNGLVAPLAFGTWGHYARHR